MRKQLIASLGFALVWLASGCASMDATLPRATASTMTQTSPAKNSDERTSATAPEARRGWSGIFRRRGAAPAPTTTQKSSQRSSLTLTPEPQRSRGQRALDVLRRSPLGRAGRIVTGRGSAAPAPEANVSSTTSPSSLTVQPTSRVVVGQPVETGSGIRSTVTGSPVEQVPGMTPMSVTQAGTNAPAMTTAPAGPSVPQPTTTDPGAGRVYVGQPVDTGSGIRSSVTGTPVEPIPGVTPAATNLQPTTASSNATSTTAGTNTLPSSPPTASLNVATPPVSQIAPGGPAPGTKVTNKKAKSTPVEVETAPDGTPIIKNAEEEKPATTKKPKKKTNG